jgi:tetratricopeptide (TPR) repeat protein
MQTLPVFVSVMLAGVLAGCGVQVHRVPPGQSLSVALAKRAVAIEQPPATTRRINPAGFPAEPDLPGADTERIAELITTANFCLEAGKRAEAIDAYEAVVKAKPDFPEARYNLAVLYQQEGQEAKALEQFRKFKELAQH